MSSAPFECGTGAATDALWSLACGETEDAAARSLRAHAASCERCGRELSELEVVAGELVRLAPEAEPPPSLRERLRGRLEAQARPPSTIQTWKDWREGSRPADLLTIPAAAASGWEPTAIEGIQARRLHVDASADRVTMLVRMAPGTAYPGHRHGGDEECLVLEGDLQVGDRRMVAGDYQVAPAGSIHGTPSTENGRLLFRTRTECVLRTPERRQRHVTPRDDATLEA